MQRFSIGGKRYRVKIVSVKPDDMFAHMRKTGLLPIFLTTMGEEHKQRLMAKGVDPLSMTKYEIRVMLNRKPASTDIWAEDELGALTIAIKDMKRRLIGHLGADRYDRPK